MIGTLEKQLARRSIDEVRVDEFASQMRRQVCDTSNLSTDNTSVALPTLDYSSSKTDRTQH